MSKWISIKDGLPETIEVFSYEAQYEYLVLQEVFAVTHRLSRENIFLITDGKSCVVAYASFMLYAKHENGGDFKFIVNTDNLNHFHLFTATHWMPLPELPE